MDSGQTDLSQVQSALPGGNDPVWLLAVGGPIVDGVAPLWRAELVVGLPELSFRRRCWRYGSCTFASLPLSANEFAKLLDANGPQQITADDLIFEFDVQQQCSWSRKPSLDQYGDRRVPRPSVDYTVNLVQPSNQFQPPTSLLIGPDSPTFVVFAAAFNAFFFDNYALTGANNPLLGRLTIRVGDPRGRITGIGIQSTHLDVDIEGEALDGTAVEFMATQDRLLVPIAGAGRVVLPLANGLPDDAWVWLRTDTDWFDYRSLGGWAAYRSPDVRDERPTEPTADLAAIIAQGENQHVEFKRQLPESKPAARHTIFKTVVAFANGDGGTMLFGVDDDGTVPGIGEATGSAADRFSSMLRSSTSPTPPCHTHEQTLDGRRVLIVEVEANNGTIYAVTVQADKPEYFVRRGATTFHARPEELSLAAQRRRSPSSAAGLS